LGEHEQAMHCGIELLQYV